MLNPLVCGYGSADIDVNDAKKSFIGMDLGYNLKFESIKSCPSKVKVIE